MTASLFPDLDPVEKPPGERLSPDRRRTLRQRADIDRGIHPLMNTPTDPDAAHTCGSCVHRVLVSHHDRTYPKCAFGVDPATQPLDQAPFASHSAATDCRAWWPGCTNWEAR